MESDLQGTDTVAMLYERIETWKKEAGRCQDLLRKHGIDLGEDVVVSPRLVAAIACESDDLTRWACLDCFDRTNGVGDPSCKRCNGSGMVRVDV